MAAAHIDRLHEFPLFSQFAATWNAVLPQLSIRYLAKDEMLARHGDPAATIWLVVSGWIALQRHTPDGREVIIGLCTKGDIFGEAGMFAQANYPYYAQVMQADTQVVAIPADIMRRLVLADTALSHYVMQELGERIASTQLKLEQMSSLSTAQRLACFLLRLCRAELQRPWRVEIPVEKHIVASYLGMKPETLSRSFAQLAQIGVRVSGATVDIADVAGLRDFVCGSCGESGMCASEEDINEVTPRHG